LLKISIDQCFFIGHFAVIHNLMYRNFYNLLESRCFFRLFCWVSLTEKNGRHVGWVEERDPTKDIGMLNPAYE